jgi:hypothetical protein
MESASVARVSVRTIPAAQSRSIALSMAITISARCPASIEAMIAVVGRQSIARRCGVSASNWGFSQRFTATSRARPLRTVMID